MPKNNLTLADYNRHDKATVDKVEFVLNNTSSKRELAKVMAYCASWNGPDELGLRCNRLYSRAVRRAEEAGFSAAHIDSYLPKSWGGDDDGTAIAFPVVKTTTPVLDSGSQREK